MYFNNIKAFYNADRLRMLTLTLKLPLISPFSHQKGPKGQIFAFPLLRGELFTDLCSLKHSYWNQWFSCEGIIYVSTY